MLPAGTTIKLLPYPDPVLEHLTIEQLHNDEALPFVLANFVNGADIQMVESCSFPRYRKARLVLSYCLVASCAWACSSEG